MRDREDETWKKENPIVGCVIVLTTTISNWFIDAADSSDKSYWIPQEPSMQGKKGRNTYPSFPSLLVEDCPYFWFVHSWVPSWFSWVSEHCKAVSKRGKVLSGSTWGKLVDKVVAGNRGEAQRIWSAASEGSSITHLLTASPSRFLRAERAAVD